MFFSSSLQLWINDKLASSAKDFSTNFLTSGNKMYYQIDTYIRKKCMHNLNFV